jgi:hypothetical protein
LLTQNFAPQKLFMLGTVDERKGGAVEMVEVVE